MNASAINPRLYPLLATIAIFVVGYAICYMQFPAMLSTRVIGNLLTDNAYLGIVAVGMTIVILSGGIDLSVGAVIAFAASSSRCCCATPAFIRWWSSRFCCWSPVPSAPRWAG
jgi:ribose/xylose/arabinose/galactoside ABC-type transport system permease subunit